MTRIFYVSICSLLLSACATMNGNGHIKSESREAGQFTGVESSASVDIDIKKGATAMVKIEGDENLLQYVTTEVKGGILIIGLKPNISFNSSHLKAYITTPVLKNLVVTGSSSILSHDFFDNEGETNFTLTGSGDIKASVHSPSVTTDLSGSGSITIKGETKTLHVTVSGSGDVKCHDLKSENTSVDVSGSGGAHVYASQTLTAEVTGSGDVYYSGNPASPRITKTGSGSIQPEK